VLVRGAVGRMVTGVGLGAGAVRIGTLRDTVGALVGVGVNDTPGMVSAMALLAVAMPAMASARVAPATYVARLPVRDDGRVWGVALTETSGVLGNGRRTPDGESGVRLGIRLDRFGIGSRL
jgi:hypothetical protein